jgi:uncharacterized protein YndB with AHSA1/START domain
MTDTVGTRTAIEQTVRIDAPPEIVWSFWTEPARLCAWWGVAAEVELQPGGPFRVEMEGGEIMLGEFTEIDPPRRLAFTFGWEGNEPGALEPGSSIVEVTLTPDGDATVVVLRHSDVPTTHAEDHGNGWAHYVGERLPAAIRVRD